MLAFSEHTDSTESVFKMDSQPLHCNPPDVQGPSIQIKFLKITLYLTAVAV